MRAVLHNLLKFIDRFLPPEALASAENRLRFRVAASIFLVDFCTASSSLLLIALGRWGGLRGEFIPVTTDQAMGWLLAYTVVDCLALYLNKKSYSLEKIFVAFMAVSFLNSITDTILNPGSFLIVAAYSLAFPIFLACFLLTSFRSRLVILTFTCIQIFVMFISLKRSSLDVPSLPQNMAFYVVTFNVFWLGLVMAYLYLKSLTQDDLDAEIDWQLRSTRLNEIGSMTRVMGALMNRSLLAFQRDWGEFRQKGEDRADALEAELNELVEISQSFAWIYRAYRQEGPSYASSQKLFRQLRILLSIHVDEKGWTLKPEVQNIEIFGPIPSMMLLLFSTISSIMESAPSQEKRQLNIELYREKGSVNWRLSWPLADQGSDQAKSSQKGNLLFFNVVQQELIRDLAQDCEAKLLQYTDDDCHRLLIRGAWR